MQTSPTSEFDFASSEFLALLVEQNSDGMVVADLKGWIRMFNRSAGELFGYTQEEAIGRVHVTTLYPPGLAHEVMRKLRSPELGGEGRVRNIRVEGIHKSGERIPVVLSVFMVMRDGVPIATCGVLNDWSERVQLEEKLEQAQAKLALSEKSALIAEVAGTAAHELNQPLTSIMGYTELLQRKLKNIGSTETKYLERILKEAERIADIVKKLGQVSSYETVEYVGQQKIIDLDRATGKFDRE